MSSRNRDSFTSFLISMPFVSLCSSYLPVYAEVQKPYVYLQSSQVEVRNLYLGVPTRTTITLINGTLLPTQFHWGKVSEPTASGSSLQPSATEAHVEAGHCPPNVLAEQRYSASLPQPVPCSIVCVKAPQRSRVSGPAFSCPASREFQFPAQEGVSGEHS